MIALNFHFVNVQCVACKGHFYLSVCTSYSWMVIAAEHVTILLFEVMLLRRFHAIKLKFWRCSGWLWHGNRQGLSSKCKHGQSCYWYYWFCEDLHGWVKFCQCSDIVLNPISATGYLSIANSVKNRPSSCATTKLIITSIRSRVSSYLKLTR